MLFYLIVLILLMHGIGHIMPFMAAWTPQASPGFAAGPWVFGGDVAVTSAVGKAFGLLGLVSMVAFVAAAIGLYTHQEWWSALLVAAAAISIITIAPWASVWPVGSLIGALAVDVLAFGLVLTSWGQQITHTM